MNLSLLLYKYKFISSVSGPVFGFSRKETPSHFEDIYEILNYNLIEFIVNIYIRIISVKFPKLFHIFPVAGTVVIL